MKKNLIRLAAAFSALTIMASSMAAQQPGVDLDEVANLKAPTIELEGKYRVAGERTRHPDAQWFEQAGFGLFISWGPESAQGSGEPWSVMVTEGGPEKSSIGPVKKYGFHPPSEFWDVAKTWNPGKYNPDKWMKAAKDAGFTYVVFVTKHHLGYALWPSKVGEMGVSRYLGGRDLLKPYVDACRKHGLKVGLYYSGMDWHFDREYMNFSRIKGKKINWLHEEVDELPKRPADFGARFREFDETQGRELLTQYGKIDLWWPDGNSPFTVEKIREMQPGIVINNRMGNRKGDYATPEGTFVGYIDAHLPGTQKTLPMIQYMLERGYWWENCNIYNGGSWHYSDPGSETIAEAGRLLWHLSIARSFGGNILAAIAPRPNGEMPDQYYSRCEELAAWMKHSRESIFNITGGGLYLTSSNVPVTIAGRNWYLHSPPKHWQPRWEFPRLIDTLEVNDIPCPGQVILLRTGERLPFDYQDATRTLRITIPTDKRTETVDVVKFELDVSVGDTYSFRNWQPRQDK